MDDILFRRKRISTLNWWMTSQPFHIYFLKKKTISMLLAVDVTLAQKFPLTTLLRNYSVHLSGSFILSAASSWTDILLRSSINDANTLSRCSKQKKTLLHKCSFILSDTINSGKLYWSVLWSIIHSRNLRIKDMIISLKFVEYLFGNWFALWP